MSSEEKPTEPVTFRVRKSRKEELDLISAIYGITLADLLRDLIDRGVEQYFSSEEIEKKAEEHLRQQAEVARRVAEQVARRKR